MMARMAAEQVQAGDSAGRLTALVSAYARRVSAAVLEQHGAASVSSPLGVWLLLAACVSASQGSDRAELEQALGCSAEEASRLLAAFDGRAPAGAAGGAGHVGEDRRCRPGGDRLGGRPASQCVVGVHAHTGGGRRVGGAGDPRPDPQPPAEDRRPDADRARVRAGDEGVVAGPVRGGAGSHASRRRQPLEVCGVAAAVGWRRRGPRDDHTHRCGRAGGSALRGRPGGPDRCLGVGRARDGTVVGACRCV